MKNLDEFLSEGKEWFEHYIKTIHEYANNLQETKELFSTTLYSIGDAVIATDKLGNVRFMNPVAETLMGWKQEEATGKPLEDIFNIINEETRKKVENPVLRVLRENIVVGLGDHTILIAKDGKEIPIADSGAPIKDDEGNLTGVVLIFRDITNLRKLEKDAQEARRYAESIVDTVREPLVVLDKDLRVISANKNFYNTFKVSPEISENVILYDLGNNQWDIPKLHELLEDIIPKNTKFENYEVEHDFESIGKRIMVLNARRIYRDSNKTQMILLAIEDITERKELEIVKKSKEQMNLILSNQKDAVFVILKNYQIAFMNQSSYDIFGDDVAGKKCYNVIKGWDHPCDQCPMKEIMESGKYKVRFEQCILIPHSDDTKFFDSITTRIENYGGEPAIVESLRDITKSKRVEQKLKESEGKYREAFNRANFYKDLFTHDMNNILQSILSGMQFSEAILDDSGNLEELKTNLRIMKDQILRGSNLITNVRKLSQLEDIEIPIKNIEICNILKNSISILEHIFQYKNINIQVHSIGEKLYIHANDFIVDVFENILINAVIHNKNPSLEITVRISRDQKNSVNYLKMEFLDNGNGITDSRKEIIFQRGFTKEKSVHGMGLGLSLVKKIIESCNGKIWVEDRVKGDHSKGSNFILLIPEVN
jgi:PAS domain S-box-containing protein